MVNIYNKGGFKNPSIPKPSGGYSSLVKPATAPMRQGGLSQLAAKAAVQGRQPAAGNPPIPQTSRTPTPSPTRPVESVPPSDTPAPTPTPHYGMITPRTEPSVPRTQGGMLGAITQGLRAPQGQARGMVGAAAEAVAPQVPGWLTPEVAQGVGFLGGASKPGGDEGEDYTYEDLYAALGGDVPPSHKGKYATPGGSQPGGGKYEAVPTTPFAGSNYAGAVGALGGMDFEKMAEKQKLVDGGMNPYIADLVMELASGEYGLSEEEKAKLIAEGAGQQAEMMAARGLGASGLAGTGFGDIYSQVHADAALLEQEQKLKAQQLLAGIIGSQEEKAASSSEAEDAKLLEWAVGVGAETVSASAKQSYLLWKEKGWSDADIQAMAYDAGDGVLYLSPPNSGVYHDDAAINDALNEMYDEGEGKPIIPQDVAGHDKHVSGDIYGWWRDDFTKKLMEKTGMSYEEALAIFESTDHPDSNQGPWEIHNGKIYPPGGYKG